MLEIPKIVNTELKEDELALWLKFIENPLNEEVQIKMKEKENKYLRQAKEELGYLSGSSDFKRLVDARAGFLRDQATFEAVGKKEGIEQGLEQGRKEGKEQGKIEEKKEIAKKLLAKKVPIEQIVEITELTEEEIKALKK